MRYLFFTAIVFFSLSAACFSQQGEGRERKTKVMPAPRNETTNNATERNGTGTYPKANSGTTELDKNNTEKNENTNNNINTGNEPKKETIRKEEANNISDDKKTVKPK